MAKAIKNSFAELRRHIESTPSRVYKLITGTGTPDTRGAPAPMGKHDFNIGSRIDFGDISQKGGKWYQRLKFQLNKNASNPQIRKFVQENGSHKVWAEADVEIVPDADPDTAERVFDNAMDELEDKLGTAR